MIDYVTGDILKDRADALVNTVNTVGVMGKGIALQFKRRFPGNFHAYHRACEAGEIEPGKVFAWYTGQLESPTWILNFPTKRHWRAKSRIADIEAGLRDLRALLDRLRVTSIAVPPLGCGNGGLEWGDVQPLIDHYLSDLDDVCVRVYLPVGAPDPVTMPVYAKAPRMTPHRAAMVAVFARYLRPGFTLGRLEAQKLIYFLQVAGAPYANLKFVQADHGPYADGIRHVLDQVDGHLIEGFGDADAASRIRPKEAAVAEAELVLQQAANQVFREAVEAVAVWIDGFDDAFGLELLASAHWVATRTDPPPPNPSEALRRLHDWNDGKKQRFDIGHVRAAWSRLEDAGLVATTVPDEGAPSRPIAAERPEPTGDLIANAL